MSCVHQGPEDDAVGEISIQAASGERAASRELPRQCRPSGDSRTKSGKGIPGRPGGPGRTGYGRILEAPAVYGC